MNLIDMTDADIEALEGVELDLTLKEALNLQSHLTHPHYSTDLNACREAEDALSEDEVLYDLYWQKKLGILQQRHLSTRLMHNIPPLLRCRAMLKARRDQLRAEKGKTP